MLNIKGRRSIRLDIEKKIKEFESIEGYDVSFDEFGYEKVKIHDCNFVCTKYKIDITLMVSSKKLLIDILNNECNIIEKLKDSRGYIVDNVFLK